ncbi:MAG TPA: restriction endonuclease subunit S, partial [Balneolaceae bacterium]|nr:restriction endonuclease subunit S [Balneolaceae bacterium]
MKILVTYKLQELTTKIGSGATPRGGKNSYKDSGISLIRSLNIYDLEFDTYGLAFIDQEQADNLSNVEVEKDDVLINITGASVARCCKVPEEILPARVNQHVSILRTKKERLDPTYLQYLLVSPFYKHKLLTFAQGGATREALTKGGLEEFEIKLPPLETQISIAKMLSAFDYLINNNIRRIEILEEMARRIYREWFVHFRYPGQENDELVDSGTELGEIPEGWEVKNFGDLVAYERDRIK